jgi:hypothetical protein
VKYSKHTKTNSNFTLGINKIMQILTCKHCNQEFSPKRVNRKNPKQFCSLTCSAESRKTRVLVQCVNCGSGTFNNRFCSKSCSASYNNKGVNRYPINPNKYKQCKTCSKETTRPTYCSDECNPKRLNLSADQKKQRHAAMHREAWQRYQAKLKNQTPPDVDKKALQEFYLNCPEGYEVDHIIPVSKGGLHCLSNLQYLTISENRRKSNKIL